MDSAIDKRIHKTVDKVIYLSSVSLHLFFFLKFILRVQCCVSPLFHYLYTQTA